MKQVTFQFVVDNTPVLDPLIEWMSHGIPTHVDIVWEEFGKEDQLLGARFNGGVQIRPLNYSKFKWIQRATINVSDSGWFLGRQFLKEQIGKPYDETALMGFVSGRDWRAANHWFCSELSMVYKEKMLVFNHPIFSPAYKITPADDILLMSSMCSLVNLPPSIVS